MRRMFHVLPLLSMIAPLAILSGCASSRHTQDEKYFLIATNIKLSYWQTARAGLSHAASTMGVKTELAGPDTYDPAETKIPAGFKPSTR